MIDSHSGQIKPHKKVLLKTLSKPMIMIADDSELQRNIFSNYFDNKDYDIHLVKDGDEAVQLYH